MANLTLEHVSFTYPGASAPALRDITMRLSQGEYVLLCGQSGREHYPGIYPHVGSRGASGADSNAHINRIQGTWHTLRTPGTSRKATMTAVQSLRLLARTYYNDTFGL
mgnify:CR=1 FL=1